MTSGDLFGDSWVTYLQEISFFSIEAARATKIGLETRGSDVVENCFFFFYFDSFSSLLSIFFTRSFVPLRFLRSSGARLMASTNFSNNYSLFVELARGRETVDE